MARTQEEIFNEMTANKSTNSNLDELLPNPDNWTALYTENNFKLLANTIVKGLSTSTVAVWRLMYYVMSYAVWVQETLFDIHAAAIETRAQELIPGTLRWYVNQSKAFQYGDDLIWDGDKYVYEDTTSLAAAAKRIVTQAAAVESQGQIIIKVAKGDVGSLEKLATAETTAFEGYLIGTPNPPFNNDGIAFAGTLITVISDNPDDLRIAYNIEYNPLLLDSSGVLIADGVTLPVEVAITNYIQGIDFNALFRVQDLTDAIQNAEGVINAVCTQCDARYGALPYSDILATTTQTYQTNAGYLEIDTQVLTYIAG